MDRARLQALESLKHEACSALGKQRKKLLGCLVGFDGQGALQQNVARVQTLVDAHGGGAGHGLAVGHRPLDGSSAAVFGQQRGVKVEVAPSRQVAASSRE